MIRFPSNSRKAYPEMGDDRSINPPPLFSENPLANNGADAFSERRQAWSLIRLLSVKSLLSPPGKIPISFISYIDSLSWHRTLDPFSLTRRPLRALNALLFVVKSKQLSIKLVTRPEMRRSLAPFWLSAIRFRCRVISSSRVRI